ncbi:MAG: Transcriptional regulator, Xre family, partial [uncultured Nocardioides sp.]
GEGQGRQVRRGPRRAPQGAARQGAPLPAAALGPRRRVQPLPEPDRARTAPTLRRGAAADRQGAPHLRRAALRARRDRQPRRGLVPRERGLGRARCPGRPRPDRAPEAVPAGRPRLVPRPQPGCGAGRGRPDL